MNILFCGTNVPNEVEHSIKNISAAGNRFQNNVINTFCKMQMNIMNLTFIGIPLMDEEKELIKNYSKKENNYLAVIKESSILKGIEEYRKYCIDSIEEADVVICYNVIYAWLYLPRLAKKKRKKSILILADYSGMNAYKSVFRKIYALMQLCAIRKFSIVIGLSNQIPHILSKKQQFLLMEGGVDEQFYSFFDECIIKSTNEIVFLYSGLLDYITGIDLLLQAFSSLNNSRAKLIITGKGNMEQEVRSLSKMDRRIEYYGHLEYSHYMEYLRNADILINPRNMKLPENQNNFPSKILEYLATGKPIISTCFPGWEKFKDNMLFCDSTADDISRCMTEMCENIPNYREINRNKACDFFWSAQLKKVIKEIESE